MTPSEPILLFSTAAAAVNIIAVIVAVYRLGRAVQKFETIGETQSREIRELKDAVKVQNELMTRLAIQNERLDGHDKQIERAFSLLDDLRRGRGFIQQDLQGEYPRA